MKVLRMGSHAALVETDGVGDALSLALWSRDRIAATDIVPAATTVLFDGVDPAALPAALAGWEPTTDARTGELVEIPVTYDGPDLDEVASIWETSVEQVVARHSAVEHVVAFCGFAPGFAYLTGSPGEVPRKATPRARVEPGSMGLAGPFTGIYPTASPGGWQLIGRTDVVLWDPARPQPALLPPGTRVRFVVA